MKIIDMGLNRRIDEVREMVETGNEEVRKVIDQVENLTQLLIRDKDEDVSSLAHELDAATSELLTTVFEAAYRVGMSEGMQLQQEINALCRGGMELRARDAPI